MVLSGIASFFGLVTEARQDKPSLPKPRSALRMMTTGDDGGRFFLGPNGVLTKSFESMRTAGMELRALVVRQAAAIRRLLALLANRGGAAAPIAIAEAGAPGGAPPSELQPSPPILRIARPPPPPDAAAEPAPPARAAPDGGGGLTMDQLVPLADSDSGPSPRSAAECAAGPPLQ